MTSSAALLKSEERNLLEALLILEEAKNHLPKFIDYLQLGYQFAKHHQLILDNLEAVERGDIERLMLLLPPGSAKSTYASVLFPPWFMGRNPLSSILCVSNTTELAERFSRRVRNLIATPEFKRIFGFALSPDEAAAGTWSNERGGECFAAGVGAAIAGRRADLGIIDDPIKTREEADSERIRDKQWDWYVNDFVTRLKPKARQILIQTRWHEDDLGGRILDREEKRWHVVKVPMEAVQGDPLGRKPGERLWPEWFTEEMVDVAKLDVRAWNALYQQDPVPLSGDIFKKEYFGEYGIPPENLHVYGASDFATQDSAGDFTEHAVIGVDWNDDIYILDWWYGQKTPDEWIERQCDLIQLHKPQIWFGEAGVIRRAIEPQLKRRMNERQAYCRLEWMASITDKVIRAIPIQSRVSMGKVSFPKHATWKEHVMTQLLKFPSGAHDDAVDALSLFGRGLELMAKPRPKKPARAQAPSGGGNLGWMG